MRDIVEEEEVEVEVEVELLLPGGNAKLVRIR